MLQSNVLRMKLLRFFCQFLPNCTPQFLINCNLLLLKFLKVNCFGQNYFLFSCSKPYYNSKIELKAWILLFWSKKKKKKNLIPLMFVSAWQRTWYACLHWSVKNEYYAYFSYHCMFPLFVCILMVSHQDTSMNKKFGKHVDLLQVKNVNWSL